MTKIDSWLTVSSGRLAPRVKAEIIAHVAGVTAKNADQHLKDTQEPDPALTLWQRTSTTIVQTHDALSGAAVLPKGIVADADIPRVAGWRKILTQLAKATRCRDTEFVMDFLRDVEFQHHQSSNGRWNPDLARWERYAVRSVADWRKSGIFGAERKNAKGRVSESTLHRVKDKLIEAGLIVAEAHLWQGDNHLWIKPTEKLSRILFEPGYWQSLQPASAPKSKSAKLKPRGLSAKHAQIDAEHHELYRKAITHQLNHLDQKMRWIVWERLTRPYAITEAIIKQPYAPKNSHRWKQLYEALGLSF